MYIELIISFTLYFCIPILLFSWLILIKSGSKMKWLMKVFIIASYIIYWIIEGEWRIFTYYYKYFLLVLLSISIIISYWKSRKLPYDKEEKYSKWFLLRIALFVAIMLIYKVGIITGVNSYFSEKPITLEFPLKEGVYAIADSGVDSNGFWDWNPTTNRGIRDHSQQYSLDIVKLNDSLRESRSFFPENLEDFQIYGQDVYSPCNGTVISIRNTVDDYLSYTGPNFYSEGNYIIIQGDEGYYIVIENLMRDGMTVNVSDRVAIGQAIAKVGNSAVSEYPHLHIYATKAPGSREYGLKISFDNKLSIKNSIFSKKN